MAEGQRYLVLKDQLARGLISFLRLQVPYRIKVNGELVCTYIADFEYFEKSSGDIIVEDVKGQILPVYALKRKLMWAVYGIKIREIINGQEKQPGQRKPRKKKKKAA